MPSPAAFPPRVGAMRQKHQRTLFAEDRNVTVYALLFFFFVGDKPLTNLTAPLLPMSMSRYSIFGLFVYLQIDLNLISSIIYTSECREFLFEGDYTVTDRSGNV